MREEKGRPKRMATGVTGRFSRRDRVQAKDVRCRTVDSGARRAARTSERSR
jgi:hypothetical protein